MKIIITIALLFSFISPLQIAEARSGCCSWHGGVCGCGCCDGTPLSAKCAPYYPWCNSQPSYVPKPSCPANSYKSGSSCVCNIGYAPSLDNARCIKIPANAHKGNGVTDVWECDYGYIEKGNTCVKKPAPVVVPTISSSSSNSFMNSSSSISMEESSSSGKTLNISSSSSQTSAKTIEPKKGFWNRFWKYLLGL